MRRSTSLMLEAGPVVKAEAFTTRRRWPLPSKPATGIPTPRGTGGRVAATPSAYGWPSNSRSSLVPNVKSDTKCTRPGRRNPIRAPCFELAGGWEPVRRAAFRWQQRVAAPGTITDAAAQPGQEPPPPSQERSRRSTRLRPSGSQLRGAADRDRCCRRAGRRARAQSPPGDWRVSAQTAAAHPLPEHRDRRARPGCGCDRAPGPARRRTGSEGRSGSHHAARPPCGEECRNRQASSPPGASSRRQAQPAAGAAPRALPVRWSRRSCCARSHRGR